MSITLSWQLVSLPNGKIFPAPAMIGRCLARFSEPDRFHLQISRCSPQCTSQTEA